MKVLLFTKDTSWCRIVGEFCKRNFDTIWLKEGDELGGIIPYPPDAHFDYIISYLSPWIIPKDILDRGDVCINFHPGPPKYPGIGGYNFALYNEDKTYGVVAHIMEEKVDSGLIFDKLEFHILPSDTVKTLKEKSMGYLLTLFYDIMDRILKGLNFYIGLELTGEKWERKPYTRKDLQELCNGEWLIDFGMDKFEEWYNACYFPYAEDRPYIQVNGTKYYIIREDHEEKKNEGTLWNYTGCDPTSYKSA